MKKGICCAGNMIVDITYPIETWLKQNELTHITEGITRSTGGSVCNTSELAGMILDMYAYFLEGEPVAALRRAAQAAKSAGLGRII